MANREQLPRDFVAAAFRPCRPRPPRGTIADDGTDAALAPIPLTLLTGFLGSGKTTLLRRALTAPEFADTAVIINEAGAVAIDHYLVDFALGDVVELPGGCLCCAVREDLAESLRGLIERRDRGEFAPSAASWSRPAASPIPAPILFTLGTDPLLDRRVRLQRVATVVDAVSGAATLDRFAEAARQAAVADALVISKTDLAPFDASARRPPRCAEPDRRAHSRRQCRRPGRCPLCAGSPPPQPSPASGGGVRRAAADGWGSDVHDLGHAHHTHGIATFTVVLDGPVGRLDFARALGGLARARGYDLLRVKGLVEFADRPGQPAVVQAAQHAMFAPEWLDAWPVDGLWADRRSRLVFIVHDIAAEEILAHFAFASTVAARVNDQEETLPCSTSSLRGGLAVLPTGAAHVDIGVDGEKIAAIGAPGSLAALGARRTIDATGQIVIPGGVDPHVHCRWPMPVPGQSQPNLTDGPDRVSQAALLGGTTTILDFALVDGDNNVQQAIERRQKEWAGDCHCDYGFHVMVQGKLDPSIPDRWREAVAAGHATVKMFTTDITPSRKGRMVEFGDIWEVLKVLAQAGGLAVIHAEDNDIVMHMYDKLTREGRTGFENMAEVHNTLSRGHVVPPGDPAGRQDRGLLALHDAHLGGDRRQRDPAARAHGVPIYGETLHQYLLYTNEDYKKPNGQIYHTYPSLKFAEDQAALWAGTDYGAIHCVATDEICCTLAKKLQGARIDDTTGGNAGVEPRVSLMYTEMVDKRGRSLENFVDLISTNAAKITGSVSAQGRAGGRLGRRHRAARPAPAHTVRAADMHEADYSPWEGRELAAWPSLTMLRGKVVVEGGRLSGATSDGQFLARKVADDIRSRPAV